MAAFWTANISIDLIERTLRGVFKSKVCNFASPPIFLPMGNSAVGALFEAAYIVLHRSSLIPFLACLQAGSCGTARPMRYCLAIYSIDL